MQKLNNLTFNKWSDFSYNMESKNITLSNITIAFSMFRKEILSNLAFYKPVKFPSQIKLLILFKVKTINHQYRTISPLQIVDINDVNILSDLFNEFWNLKSEEYYVATYSDIILGGLVYFRNKI